jgi:hypothetical protein
MLASTPGATRVGDASGAEREVASFPIFGPPRGLPPGGLGPFGSGGADPGVLEDDAPATAAAAAAATCGAVRTCVVRALVAQASEQARQPFGPNKTCCAYHRRRAQGALAALGRLACVSRAYREEVLQPWHVDTLLRGLAEPTWRAWARRCDDAGGNPNPNPPSFNSPQISGASSSSALVRPSLLGTLWRLLQTESRLPRVITQCHDGAAAFDATAHAPLLRPAAVFLPPREAALGRWRPTKAGGSLVYPRHVIHRVL